MKPSPSVVDTVSSSRARPASPARRRGRRPVFVGEVPVVLGRPEGACVAVGRQRRPRCRARRHRLRGRKRSRPRRATRGGGGGVAAAVSVWTPSTRTTRRERQHARSASTISATAAAGQRRPPAPRASRPLRARPATSVPLATSSRRPYVRSSSARHRLELGHELVHGPEPVARLLRHRALDRQVEPRAGNRARLLEHARRRLVHVPHRDRDEVVARRRAPRRSAARRGRRRASRRRSGRRPSCPWACSGAM